MSRPRVVSGTHIHMSATDSELHLQMSGFLSRRDAMLAQIL